ncbi:NADPH dehydrogenase [Coniochaeta sp. 2T2.1]|nr:NADPH dehydrogenase [Coniochaeta sp. 2T2.1]
MTVKKNTASAPAPGIPYYTPLQTPPAGTAPAEPEGTTAVPTLFSPLKLRGMTLNNRFAVAPMCTYSADDGHLTDWHLVHLGSYAGRGAALTIVEATSVTPNGRISPEDSGLWQDSQIAPLKRIADYVHSQGQKIGIQLAHAGRKANTFAPWHYKGAGVRDVVPVEQGGWPDNVWAPSAVPFSATYPDPKAMTVEEIEGLVQSWADAARRAVEAGMDTIEIHAAHGYLMTQFLSPLSNKRTDKYGGSFENRTRLLIDVIKAVRAVIPETMPLLVRISAVEWMEWSGEECWTLDQTIRLAKMLPDLGVDLLDVSSGGNAETQKIKLHPYYQVDLAGAIREALKADGKQLLIGAVGLITNAEMARSIVQEDGSLAGVQNGTVEVEGERGQKSKADLVLVARQFLKEPEFVLRVAQQLGVEVAWPLQYRRGRWPRGAQL